MSSLRGDERAVWALPRAVDAMAEAARQAGKPSALWFAGFGYQGLSLGWTFGVTIALPLLIAAAPNAAWLQSALFARPTGISSIIDPLTVFRDGEWPVFIVLMFVFFRLVTGLARLSPGRAWDEAREDRRTPRLRAAWALGKGVTLSAIGLWTQILMMMFGAALLFIGPVKLLADLGGPEPDNPFTVLFSGASIALILVYSFLLSILFQLALHSLVQNRRGVGSALLHAWRIAKNDPLATVRATLIDSVLYFTVVALLVTYFVVVNLNERTSLVLILPAALLESFAGCTRCAYWARAYRALGGLSTAEEEAPTI